jgi:predicted Zn-dependent protease
VAILFQECGKPGEAMSRLSVLADKYPDRAEIYSMRAEIEAEANQPELAIMDLDKAISLQPDNKNMILTRGFIHLKNNNKFLAKRDFERAIALGVPRGQLKKELKMVK